MNRPSADFLSLMIMKLLLVIHCMIFMAGSVSAADTATDQSALLALKAHITNDPTKIISTNWSTKTSVCSWIGIACSIHHQRVTVLNISNMGLVGTIPPQLGNLSFLQRLSLTGNGFHGSLPDELARLSRLKVLVLRSNNFTGEIPAWFQFLPKLEVLIADHNSFMGSFSSSLFNNISSLAMLDFSYNHLSGSLPLNSLNMSSLLVFDLSNNRISGHLPVSFFNVPSLEIIDLGFNSLSGELHKDIFDHLPRLIGLFLTENQFVGEIPSSLFKCTQLEYLSLSTNNFSGTISSDISNLTELTILYLGWNNFKAGEIPKEIGNLHNLENLGLPSCNLYGQVPSSIFNISTLKEISLVENQLSGSLPPSFGIGLPRLEELYLGQNNFHGTIPNSIANASLLRFIDLPDNKFSGYIPRSLGNLHSLEWLNLHDNTLTDHSSFSDSSILSYLANCKYLRFLDLSNNPLNGTFPTSMANFSTSLATFHISNCNMRGEIPKDIDNMSGLVLFSLEYNELTGSIPTNIGRLKGLQHLSFRRNRLQGIINDGICQLHHLAFLHLDENELSGSLPTCFNNLLSLKEISLGFNKFNFSIPSTIWDLNYVQVLNISSNSLRGSLSPEVGNLKVLQMLDLSNNQISGNIPANIGGLQYMTNLSLAYNRLEGQIPESFGKLISLELMDLSHNNLSGVIPKSMEALSYLKYLNLSFNRLQGEIPTKGPFANLSRESFKGNDALCGAFGPQVPLCKVDGTGKSKGITMVVMKCIAGVVPPIVIGLLLAFILIRKRRQRRRNAREVPASEYTSELATWKRISYGEILRATDGFSERNFLGAGSFGSVYKGTLSDGMVVAVKIFNLQREGGYKSFDVECEVIRNIRHRNLVKVLTSCSKIDFKALVLEYMCHGSLERWLYSHNYNLNLLQRLDIMIDIASALEYLHYGYSTPVVHCDIKPNNVLLDADMVAHLTDFGIAKLLAGDDSITQTMTMATIGYMAPEYGLEGIVSTKSDVFSYGILLMETFTGKRPTDDMFSEELSLRKWVRDSIPHAINDVADTRLLPFEGPFDPEKECITSLMGLALSCTENEPDERLNLKDALFKLNTIKKRVSLHY